MQDWRVLYGRNFWAMRGRGKPGVEISLGHRFRWGDADWQALHAFSCGDILNRFETDTGAVGGGAVSWLPQILVTAYRLCAVFFLIWIYSPAMALIALGGAPLGLRNRAHLAGQSDFAHHGPVRLDGAVSEGRGDGGAERKIRRRLVERHAAGDVDVDVLVVKPEIRALLHHGQQQRKQKG